MEDSPLISIILPVYNGENFLGQAIQSCLDQTYANFELIIVNDASTDRSLEIAREYGKNDKRIKILTNPENFKLPGSLNRGHKAAAGKFLTWTSDDNILKSDFLKVLLEEITFSNYDLIFSDFDIIWENGELKRRHKAGPLEELIFGDIIGASFLYKKEVFEGLNGYNPNLFLTEDYDFFLRASLHYKIGYLSKSLYEYRLHSNSLTSNISINPDYSKDHKIALKSMYQGLKKESILDDPTIDLLMKLYLHENVSVKEYLAQKDNIKYHILQFHQNAKNHMVKNTDILSNKIFWNWYSNNKDQTLLNLMRVIIYDRSILFNKKNNRNSVIQMIINCVNPFKKDRNRS